jgi:hypothetical protein
LLIPRICVEDENKLALLLRVLFVAIVELLWLLLGPDGFTSILVVTVGSSVWISIASGSKLDVRDLMTFLLCCLLMDFTTDSICLAWLWAT